MSKGTEGVGGGGGGWWGSAQSAAKSLGDAADKVIEEVAETLNSPEALKTTANNVSLGATIAEVFFVAAGVFSLIAAASSGALLIGAITLTLCVLSAILSNDVREIADELAKGGKMQGVKALLNTNSKEEEACVTAAKNAGTYILKETLIRWCFSPWHNE